MDASTNKTKTKTKALTEKQKALVEKYFPLVGKIVNSIRHGLPAFADIDELHSAGLTGLLDAVKKVDAAKMETFAGYASMRIRGSILDALRKIDYMSRSARQEAKHIKSTKEKLEAKLNRPPTDEELREALKLTPKQFEKMSRRTMQFSFTSLDDNQESGDNSVNLNEVIADEDAPSAVEEIEKRELSDDLKERLDVLPERQKKILHDYYFNNKKLADIAQDLHLTEARICQIHSQAIRQLSTEMRS